MKNLTSWGIKIEVHYFTKNANYYNNSNTNGTNNWLCNNSSQSYLVPSS